MIHAATMRLGGPTSAEIIREATASTLRVADELGARSLALVAFGTGVGGFPLDEAARIEAEEVRRHLDGGSALERVVFCVFGERGARGVRARRLARFSLSERRCLGEPRSAAAHARSCGPGSGAAPRPGRKPRVATRGAGPAGPIAVDLVGRPGLAQRQQLRPP